MKLINLSIQGVTPMLMHRFTDASQLAATSGERSSIATEDKTPEELARESLYTDENGNIGWPAPNIFRGLVDAGSYFKIGRSKVTTQRSSLIPAAVTVMPEFIPVKPNTWHVDTRPCRIPATGGRILRHRPIFHQWGMTFSIEIDDTLISVKMMREIVDALGIRVGIGDFRPLCKGPFGKFKCTSWKVSE